MSELSPAVSAERRALLLELFAEWTTLEAFLDGAAGRLPIIPLCTPNLNQAGCDYHGPTCESPGKLPRVKWKDYQDGPLPAAAEVARWRRQWPAANWGLLTGPASGILLLDDDAKGTARPTFAATVQVFSGRPGGHHYYLAYPDEETIRNAAGVLPGWDVRGAGGLVYLPGSLHKSGNRYRLDAPSVAHGFAPVTPALQAELAPPPAFGMPRDRAPLDLAAWLQGVDEGARDDALWRGIYKLHAVGVPEAWAEHLALETAAACRPPLPAATVYEKIRRAYQTAAPAAEARPQDAGRPAPPCQACPYAAENAQLRAERSAVFDVLRNPALKAEARTALATVAVVGSAQSRGQSAPDGRTRLPLVAIAEASGQSTDTCSRHLERLDKDYRFVQRHYTRTADGHQALSVTVPALADGIPATLRALATLEPAEGRTVPKHGGKRPPRCPSCPGAVIREEHRFICQDCGTVLLTEVSEHPPVAARPQDAGWGPAPGAPATKAADTYLEAATCGLAPAPPPAPPRSQRPPPEATLQDAAWPVLAVDPAAPEWPALEDEWAAEADAWPDDDAARVPPPVPRDAGVAWCTRHRRPLLGWEEQHTGVCGFCAAERRDGVLLTGVTA